MSQFVKTNKQYMAHSFSASLQLGCTLEDMYSGEQLEFIQSHVAPDTVYKMSILEESGDGAPVRMVANLPVPDHIWRICFERYPLEEATPEWKSLISSTVGSTRTEDAVYSAVHTPISQKAVTAQHIMLLLAPWASHRFSPTSPIPPSLTMAGLQGEEDMDQETSITHFAEHHTMGDAWRAAFQVPVKTAAPAPPVSGAPLRAVAHDSSLDVGVDLAGYGEAEVAPQCGGGSGGVVGAQAAAVAERMREGRAPAGVRMRQLLNADDIGADEWRGMSQDAQGYEAGVQLMTAAPSHGEVLTPAIPVRGGDACIPDGVSWGEYTEAMVSSATLLATEHPEMACHDPHGFARIVQSMCWE